MNLQSIFGASNPPQSDVIERLCAGFKKFSSLFMFPIYRSRMTESRCIDSTRIICEELYRDTRAPTAVNPDPK